MKNNDNVIEIKPKNGRGRPKGSKNKPRIGRRPKYIEKPQDLPEESKKKLIEHEFHKYQSINKITIKQLKEIMAVNFGNIKDTAECLNIPYHTLYVKIQYSKDLKFYAEQCRTQLIEMAESVILEKLRNKDAKTAMFICETLGKNKGYSKKEEREISGKDGKPIQYEQMEEKLKVANSIISDSLKQVI